jgi:hypothetical protein
MAEQIETPEMIAAMIAKNGIKIGGIKNLLKENTAERNHANALNDTLTRNNNKLKNEKDHQYYEMAGRLVKYEAAQIFSEVIPYAINNGLFYSCDSELLGVKTEIKEYTNKQGKTHYAHYTIYGTYLEKCSQNNDTPKNYKGNFLMKNYADKFEVDTTKSEYKTKYDFIKIKSN